MARNFVYIATQPNGLYKIGYSRNPEQRRLTLSAVEKAPVWMFRSFARPAGDAYEIEQRAHAILSEYCVHGEWYAVSFKRAVWAIERAIRDADRVAWQRRRLEWSEQMEVERGERPSRDELRRLADAGFFGPVPELILEPAL
ncbi:MAG: hypothetical protein NVS1B6_15850 [Steroidobacteraceae bacterium]